MSAIFLRLGRHGSNSKGRLLKVDGKLVFHVEAYDDERGKIGEGESMSVLSSTMKNSEQGR